MNPNEDTSISSSSKSTKVLYSMMHLYLTSVGTSTTASMNLLLPPGRGWSTWNHTNPSKRGGAQFAGKEAQNDSDVVTCILLAANNSILTRDYNGSEIKSFGWVLLTLLHEDSPLEKLFFFFTTDLMDDNDSFMTTRQEKNYLLLKITVIKM